MMPRLALLCLNLLQLAERNPIMSKTANQSLFLYIGFMIWLVFSAAWVNADCYSDCMALYGCESSIDSSYCSGTSARCSTECRNSANNKSYGAIAYSAIDGAYGYSDRWDNQEKAERTALKYCSENGSGCEIIVWFYNSCGAVAADGNTVTWGQDTSETEAKRKALDECRRRAGGQNCEIKISHCSP
jgi:hypothetical protein